MSDALEFSVEWGPPSPDTGSNEGEGEGEGVVGRAVLALGRRDCGTFARDLGEFMERNER